MGFACARKFKLLSVVVGCVFRRDAVDQAKTNQRKLVTSALGAAVLLKVPSARCANCVVSALGFCFCWQQMLGACSV